MALSDDEIKRLAEQVALIEEKREATKKLSEEERKARDILIESLSIQRDINRDSKEYIENRKNLKKLQKEIGSLEDKIAKSKLRQQIAESKLATATEAEKKELAEILVYEKQLLELLGARLEKQKQTIRATNIALAQASKYKAILAQSKDDINQVKNAWGKISKFVGGFSDVLKWEKSIKMTALNMGLTGDRASALSKNIQTAAFRTAEFGVGIEEIAKIQGTYSDELGRAIDLGSAAAERLGAMSVATGLGAEGAAKFAAEMDVIGMSAGRTADFVEQTMNDSRSMGLNTTKVVRVLSQNLKMLNKYNFKGGAKGLKEMAQSSVKLGVGMEMAAPFAEKLYDIEGAVETSAQLQVMGGEWSKLADPFKLMYMARNDMAGLTKELGNATKGMAFFNKENGGLEISALDMDKLRKISQMTNVSMDELVTTAKNLKKFEMFDMQIGAKFKDKGVKEFIANTATLNEKGEAEIMIGSKPTLLKALTAADEQIFTKMIAEKVSMEKAAKDARSLDELWSNTVMKLKQSLLPIVEAITAKLTPALEGLMEKLNKPEFIAGILKFGKVIGDFIGGIGAFIIKFPVLSAGLFGLFEVGKWFLSGMSLRAGFNAAGGGGLAPMGPQPMTLGSKLMGKNVMGGKLAMGTMGSMAAGAGLGIAGMGLDYGRSKMDNPESTGGKLLGVGASALKGAGMGMMFGPWGAAIGGALGGLLGAYNEFKSKGEEANEKVKNIGNGGGAMPVNDGVVFNPRDKFMKVNDGMMVDGTNINGNKQLAQTLASMAPTFGNKKGLMPGTSNASSSTSTSAAINHKFDDIKINGTIMLTTANGLSADLSDDLLRNPAFVRSISKMVHVETDKNFKGGKISG